MGTPPGEAVLIAFRALRLYLGEIGPERIERERQRLCRDRPAEQIGIISESLTREFGI